MSSDNLPSDLYANFNFKLEEKLKAAKEISEDVQKVLIHFDENHVPGEIVAQLERLKWVFNVADYKKDRYVDISVEFVQSISKKGKATSFLSLRLWTGAEARVGLDLAGRLREAVDWPVIYEIKPLKKKEVKKLAKGMSEISLVYSSSGKWVKAIALGFPEGKKRWWQRLS